MTYSHLHLLNTKSTLIIDDDEGIRDNLQEILGLYYACVKVAANGFEAMKILQSSKFDCLFLDIHMPKMNGLELIEKIRQTDKNIPIVILSAHDDKEYLLKAIDLHVNKYLIKPLNIDSLFSILDELANLLCENKQYQKLSLGFSYNQNNKSIRTPKGEEITLSKGEANLLEYFMANKNQILSFEIISEELFLGESSVDAIKSLIKDLRKKTHKALIKNIYSQGYICEI